MIPVPTLAVFLGLNAAAADFLVTHVHHDDLVHQYLTQDDKVLTVGAGGEDTAPIPDLHEDAVFVPENQPNLRHAILMPGPCPLDETDGPIPLDETDGPIPLDETDGPIPFELLFLHSADQGTGMWVGNGVDLKFIVLGDQGVHMDDPSALHQAAEIVRDRAFEQGWSSQDLATLADGLERGPDFIHRDTASMILLMAAE
jgi:hypothetical protein